MDLLNRVLDKVAEVANEAYLEFSRWVDRLDDMEKLFFMVVFILILFSFGAGWMIDSRFDVQDVMNFF